MSLISSCSTIADTECYSDVFCRATQLQQKTDKTVNTLTLLTDSVTVKQCGKQLLSHAQFLDCFGVVLVVFGLITNQLATQAL